MNTINNNKHLAKINNDFDISLTKNQLKDGFYTRKLYDNSISFGSTFKITSFSNYSSDKEPDKNKK